MKFSEAQLKALDTVYSGPFRDIALYGGSRSGKTVLHVWSVLARAVKAAGSRHAIFRFRFNHCKQSIGLETIPFVLKEFFPALKVEPDKSDWYWKLPNGSEIWLGGLDDKERTEKILGKEYVTVFANECSQIPYASIQLLRTRLAQKVLQRFPGKPDTWMMPRFFYDYNPPSKGHWTYQLFEKRQDPILKKNLPDPDSYISFRMNPEDNRENLAEGYLETLKNASPFYRRRFYLGEYADENPDALFSDAVFETWRVNDGIIPDMVRIVVAVDPSGAGDQENADQDAIGIVVAGLGTNGNAYILEDVTVKAGPETWGRVATSAYDRHRADVIVGEKNFGGDMVRFTIQASMAKAPFKFVTASRGKHVRAAPIAALYSQGKVRHVGEFKELEEEYAGFSTAGYIGSKSPNRADAAIWALTELFPGIVREDEQMTRKLTEPSQFTRRLEFV